MSQPNKKNLFLSITNLGHFPTETNQTISTYRSTHQYDPPSTQAQKDNMQKQIPILRGSLVHKPPKLSQSLTSPNSTDHNRMASLPSPVESNQSGFPSLIIFSNNNQQQNQQRNSSYLYQLQLQQLQDENKKLFHDMTPSKRRMLIKSQQMVEGDITSMSTPRNHLIRTKIGSLHTQNPNIGKNTSDCVRSLNTESKQILTPVSQSINNGSNANSQLINNLNSKEISTLTNQIAINQDYIFPMNQKDLSNTHSIRHFLKSKNDFQLNVKELAKTYKKTKQKLIEDRKLLKKDKSLFANVSSQINSLQEIGQQTISNPETPSSSFRNINFLLKNTNNLLLKQKQSSKYFQESEQQLQEQTSLQQKQEQYIYQQEDEEDIKFDNYFNQNAEIKEAMIKDENERILAEQSARMIQKLSHHQLNGNPNNLRLLSIHSSPSSLNNVKQISPPKSSPSKRLLSLTTAEKELEVDNQEVMRETISQILNKGSSKKKIIMKESEQQLKVIKDILPKQSQQQQQQKQKQQSDKKKEQLKQEEILKEQQLSQKLISKGLIPDQPPQLLANKLKIQSYFMKKDIQEETRKVVFKQLIDEFDPNKLKHPITDSQEITLMLQSLQPFYFQAEKPLPKKRAFPSFYLAVKKVELLNSLTGKLKLNMEPLTDRPKRKISFAAVDLIHSTSPSSRIKASS